MSIARWYILEVMKVLLTPLILNENTDESYFLCKNLVTLLSTATHTVGICATSNNNFHHASFYASSKPSSSLNKSKTDEKSYEDYLYNRNASSAKFLKKDLIAINNAIKAFKPDLIITHDRLSAIIAGKNANIPVYGIVHSSIFTYKNLSSQVLSGLNETLRNNKFEQVFSLEEFYNLADKLFVFGPLETSPFVSDKEVIRIGIENIYQPDIDKTNDIFIFLNDLDKSKRHLTKLIKEAFEGAPYKVNAYVKQKSESSTNNINFITPKLSQLYPCKLCIHDGNNYLFNQCLALGIPQLIIANNNFINISNGMKAQRNHFGLCLFEDELSMESLYEAYYHLASNNSYFKNAEILKASTLTEGDLSKILDYL